MKKKGQSTIEIVVLIAIIAVAVLSMNRYVRRTIMGRLKSSADQLGPQFSVNAISYMNSYTTVNVSYTTNTSWGGEETKNYTMKNITSYSNIELKPLKEEEFLK